VASCDAKEHVVRKVLQDTEAETRAQYADEQLVSENQKLKAQLEKLKNALMSKKGETTSLNDGSSEIFPADSSLSSGGPLQRYKSALAQVTARKKKLLEYYQGDAKILKDAVAKRGGQAEAVLRAKMASAMLSGTSAQGTDADAEAAKFTIVAVGSSVTAGHDTFLSSAWPAVIDRVLSPLWKAAGVKLTVRNMAVGGRDPNPWPLCMPQMVGDDADIIIREWEYWPFDAGIDSNLIAKPGKDSQKASMELFIRNSLTLQKQPAAHFLKMSHERAGGQSSWFLNWLKSDGDLGAYSGFALNAFDAFGKPFDRLRKGKGFKIDKPQMKKDGDEKCPENELSNVANCPPIVTKQDGYHTRAQHWGYDEKAHPKWKELVQKNWTGRSVRELAPCPTRTRGHRPPVRVLLHAGHGASAGAACEVRYRNGFETGEDR
jgi:hypothetical protein